MRLLALLLMLMTSGAPHLVAELCAHDDVASADAATDDCGCADEDCSPVCHDCACVGRAVAIGPPLFAPLPVEERAIELLARRRSSEGPTFVVPSPPGLGVFHPPRA